MAGLETRTADEDYHRVQNGDYHGVRDGKPLAVRVECRRKGKEEWTEARLTSIDWYDVKGVGSGHLLTCKWFVYIRPEGGSR